MRIRQDADVRRRRVDRVQILVRRQVKDAGQVVYRVLRDRVEELRAVFKEVVEAAVGNPGLLGDRQDRKIGLLFGDQLDAGVQ